MVKFCYAFKISLEEYVDAQYFRNLAYLQIGFSIVLELYVLRLLNIYVWNYILSAF